MLLTQLNPRQNKWEKELAFKHPELDDCDKSKKTQIKDEQREIDQAKLHSSLGQTDNS